ncbi:hypothetical protein PIB30_053989, partial [Stylosanthes scabra]|nr:hypothetical protein [Stylosanthes scabra]
SNLGLLYFTPKDPDALITLVLVLHSPAVQQHSSLWSLHLRRVSQCQRFHYSKRLLAVTPSPRGSRRRCCVSQRAAGVRVAVAIPALSSRHRWCVPLRRDPVTSRLLRRDPSSAFSARLIAIMTNVTASERSMQKLVLNSVN